MNIAMEQTEEYVDGQLKAKYGDCFIRGNNGKFVSFEMAYISPATTKICGQYFATHLLMQYPLGAVFGVFPTIL